MGMIHKCPSLSDDKIVDNRFTRFHHGPRTDLVHSVNVIWDNQSVPVNRCPLGKMICKLNLNVLTGERELE